MRNDNQKTMPISAIINPPRTNGVSRTSFCIAGDMTTQRAAKAVVKSPPNIHPYTDRTKARVRLSISAVLAEIHAGCC